MDFKDLENLTKLDFGDDDDDDDFTIGAAPVTSLKDDDDDEDVVPIGAASLSSLEDDEDGEDIVPIGAAPSPFGNLDEESLAPIAFLDDEDDSSLVLGIGEKPLTAEEIEERDRLLAEEAKKMTSEFGFTKLKKPLFRSNLDELFEDDEELDSLGAVLNSGGSLIGLGIIDTPKTVLLETSKQKEEQLLLGSGQEGDTPPVSETEQKYELQLTAREYMIQVYQPAETHIQEIDQINKDIYYHMNGLQDKWPKAANRLKEHLEKPAYDMIPPHTAIRGPLTRGARRLKSYLVNTVMEYVDSSLEFDTETEIARFLKLWTDNKVQDLTQEITQKLVSVVRGFFKYAASVVEETSLEIAKLSYPERDLPVYYPAQVVNKHYVCQCGEAIPLPGDRPALWVTIREVNKTLKVSMPNEKVYCPNCNIDLVLPKPLVAILEDKISSYVKRHISRAPETRIYRPPIAVLEQMIPTDSKSLLQIELDSSTVIDNLSNSVRPQDTALTAYKRLMSYWMSFEEAEQNTKEILKGKEFSDLTNLAIDVASRLETAQVAELSAYRFTRTLLHYLEGYGLFKITEERSALAKVVEKEELGRHFFDDEYAIEWLHAYAPHLASLEVIYKDTEVKPINIRPEYLDVISYIVTLRFLCNPSFFVPDKKIGKWIKNPGVGAGPINNILFKFEMDEELQVSFSKREMINTKVYYNYSAAWADYFSFIKEILVPIRTTQNFDSEFSNFIRGFARKTYKTYYSFELEFNEYLVPPTPQFREFKDLFRRFGKYLFHGIAVDEQRKNLAKAIHIHMIAKLKDPSMKSFESQFIMSDKPATDAVSLIPKAEIFDESLEVVRAKMVLKAAIDLAVLPEPFHSKREEDGAHTLTVEYMIEESDSLVNDDKFNSRYGREIECILLQNTTEV